MSRPLNSSELADTAVAAEKLATPERLDVELASSQERLEELLPYWRTAEQNRLEDTMLGAADWLVPMFRHMRHGNANIDVVVVREQQGGPLRAMVPVVKSGLRYGVPLKMAMSWANDLFFMGVPLIDKHDAQAVLLEALRGIGTLTGARATVFQLLPQDGEFAACLRQLAREQGLAIAELDPFERAALVTGGDFDGWFNEHFPRKRRKEFRRLRNRLGEQGELVFEVHDGEQPLDDWISGFLELESAGWKGERGTAVACNEDLSAFLQEALGGLAASGKLMFWRLTLDRRVIATMFAVKSGRKAWLLKIAYAEDWARYSPGVLLVLDVTRYLLERGDIDFIDSSAIPDHPMINHVWRDRIAMTDIMIAVPGTGNSLFSFVERAERTRRRARNFAKSIYHRVSKRGPR